MFLKSLKISTKDCVIRDITFRKGLNLIVDESDNQITGNGVGKTTVIKLIDYCFGANKNVIWKDHENQKKDYEIVKTFLVENEVRITASFVGSLDEPSSNDIVIKRNFIERGKKVLRQINEEQYTAEEFEDQLKQIFFPKLKAERPTFRQIISHNIRYTDLAVNNTLKTLSSFTSDQEYEALYLFLLGCNGYDGEEKEKLITEIKKEETFKRRLERDETKNGYKSILGVINDELNELMTKKHALNLNENYKKDLESLDQIKYQKGRLGKKCGQLKLRKKLIKEAEKELLSKATDTDLAPLKVLYSQMSSYTELNKVFEDLVQYHNKMIEERKKFVTEELPELEKLIVEAESELNRLILQEQTLSKKIAVSDTYEGLEQLIVEIAEKSKEQGQHEQTIQQIEGVESTLNELKKELKSIEQSLYSDEFKKIVDQKVEKFNKYFSGISGELYGEKFVLKYDVEENKKKQKFYKFSTFNANVSSGKKQGEISAFDIAYIKFADEEKMECLHFLLNDKRELMHGKQLEAVADIVENSNIQFIVPILKDKLPEELNREEYFTVKLSATDKLFKIESFNPRSE